MYNVDSDQSVTQENEKSNQYNNESVRLPVPYKYFSFGKDNHLAIPAVIRSVAANAIP